VHVKSRGKQLSESDLTITEIARRAGIRPSAIRFYENVGLLPTPNRLHGHRRYDERVLERLTIIAAAQQMGFTIAEIGALIHGFSAETPASARWQSLAREKLPEIEARIRRAQGMKRLLEQSLRCECPTLDACAQVLRTCPAAP
jgi:MerR family redox-sensitive transcriptional activator SoxR